MRVIRQKDALHEDATNAPLFYGGKVTRVPIVGGDTSTNFNFAIVEFEAGAKNKFHSHTSDQILFGTSGTGIVADEHEEIVMNAGDTAHIPAGEKHWHGATDTSDFAHISLTRPDSTTTTYD